MVHNLAGSIYSTPQRIHHAPMNNWLLSCRWMCPSMGASWVAAGSSSRRSNASLMLRSARMRCHLLSFSGTSAFARTSKGPLPTSKENRTSVEAASVRENNSFQQKWLATAPAKHFHSFQKCFCFNNYADVFSNSF